jgi:hypothetical protein
MTDTENTQTNADEGSALLAGAILVGAVLLVIGAIVGFHLYHNYQHCLHHLQPVSAFPHALRIGNTDSLRPLGSPNEGVAIYTRVKLSKDCRWFDRSFCDLILGNGMYNPSLFAVFSRPGRPSVCLRSDGVNQETYYRAARYLNLDPRDDGNWDFTFENLPSGHWHVTFALALNSEDNYYGTPKFVASAILGQTDINAHPRQFLKYGASIHSLTKTKVSCKTATA